ncbi:MAG: hypothetical protein PWQ37_2066 [Candidatus Petromonas sp.]|jgi:DNA-binding CsgD family transcriptional regulator|nr:hypothetical protein [Candidatus Petromonas sp.]
MKSDPTITTLKDLIDSYCSSKSDMEIANLLHISIDDIKSVRDKSVDKLNKKI